MARTWPRTAKNKQLENTLHRGEPGCYIRRPKHRQFHRLVDRSGCHRRGHRIRHSRRRLQKIRKRNAGSPLWRLVVRSRLTIFLFICLRIYPLRYTDLLCKDDIHRRLHKLINNGSWQGINVVLKTSGTFTTWQQNNWYTQKHRYVDYRTNYGNDIRVKTKFNT